jgi:hypothetical protein
VRVEHVIWIWMENKPYDQIIGSDDAAYMTTLARSCGLARNYTAITNPSLPNYIAATSGGLPRPGRVLVAILHDEPPEKLPAGRLAGESLFTQLSPRPNGWRAYAESMPTACASGDKGRYAARHNPAVYYGRITAKDCRKRDLPMGTESGGAFQGDLNSPAPLPAFSFVTPDLCNDSHGALSCLPRVEVADHWLERWMNAITASHSYTSGHTVVFITWDEGKVPLESQLAQVFHRGFPERGKPCRLGGREPRCHVALLVVSPATQAGTESDAPFNHYSLLKTTEQLLGTECFLRHAGDPTTTSMSNAFNLGSPAQRKIDAPVC